MMRRRRHRTRQCTRALRALAALVLLSSGCDRILPQRQDESLPDIEDVRQLYEQHGVQAEFRYSGNVLELVVVQPADQLRRGGSLWARVGPHIYLFSPGTRELFDRFAGVAGVRAITRAGNEDVARALLVRDELNEFGWRRATNLLGQALEHGSARPTTMERLAQFGEEHTTFEHNPDYVPPRGR